jgi:peptidylprolyl isomerase
MRGRSSLGCATVNNFKALNPTLRSRAGIALAALGASVLIAGCGSSGDSSTITIGNEDSANNALITAGNKKPVTTPTSGTLSIEPKITPPPGPAPKTLVKKDLVVGTGPEAKTGDVVHVNYVGALYSNGKVFDASWKRKETFEFTLGKAQVIVGWEQGVPGMKVGGRRELIVPSALAYGAAGSPPTIPPNAPLIFVIDLLGT